MMISTLDSKTETTYSITQVNDLPFPHISSGKVRELFDLGDYLLMVATDRVSAFDVILPDGVPGKGTLLTQMSLAWFEKTKHIIPNHIPKNHQELLQEYLREFPELIPRSMVVEKVNPLPIEAIVRGYLAGSGWKHYQKTQELFGHPLPEDLNENDPLPEPLFTPTTKAHVGHDMPLTEAETAEKLGHALFEHVKRASLELFTFGQEKANDADLILADTKLEFGLDPDGNLLLIDEVLTPDSSRFWQKEAYLEGNPTPYDKQLIRNYLLREEWNKKPPTPSLPPSIIESTRQRYQEVYEALQSL